MKESGASHRAGMVIHQTALVFARDRKKYNNCTMSLVFLGPVEHFSHESERTIEMVWQLRYPMPVEMFEENNRGGDENSHFKNHFSFLKLLYLGENI